MSQTKPTLLYFIYFLACFNLVSSVQTLYLTHEGISFFNIGILMAFFQVTKLVAELPTGYIADRFGKKKSVISSVLLESIGLIIALFYPTMLGFIFAMIIGGIAYTLSSGALDALLIEEMLATKSRSLEQINSVTRVLFYVGMGLSSLCAGIIARFSFDWVYMITIMIQIVLIYLLITRLKTTIEQHEVKQIIRVNDIKSYLMHHQKIFYILGVDFAYAVAFLPTGVFYVNYLSSRGIDIAIIGTLTTIQLIGSAIIGIWSHRLLKHIRIAHVLVGGPLIGLSALLAFAISPNIILSIFFYILASVIFCSYAPIFSRIFHEHLENNIRATVMSIRSLLFAFVGLTMNPLFGYLIENIGFQLTFVVGIILSTFLIVVNSFIFKKVLATC